MKISIIITCYNLESYIEEAICSVLNQVHGEFNKEIIVVDDASTDSSCEIISKYDDIILLKNSVNSGVLLSTVRGIKYSTGDIICFLDGDDIWSCNKLKMVAEKFSENKNLVFLTHNYEYIDSNGEFIKNTDLSQRKLVEIDSYEIMSNVIKRGILTSPGYVWLGSAYCIRRASLDIAKFEAWVSSLPEPEFTYQDWPIAYWLASSSAGDFGYIKDVLFQYRIHGTNYSGDARTLNKMLRNLRKSNNTNIALLDIARHVFPNKHNEEFCESKSNYSKYLTSLYSGNRTMSLLLLMHCLKYIYKSNILTKELLRYVLIMLLGPRIFLNITKRI